LIIILALLFGLWQGPGGCSTRAHNQEALESLKVFDFKGAVDNLEAALRLDPDSVVVRVNLSLAHFYAGNLEEANQGLEQVLKKDPDEPYARYLFAVIADREGRTQAAKTNFRKVLELVPGDPGSYYHLGLLALREEEPGRAVELFEQSLAGNPGCTASLYNLGRALLACGRKEEASAVLARFRALQEKKPPGLGGGMGDPSLLVGKYGQPRGIPE